MKRIILVRHGRTRHNERGVYNGNGDLPLDAAGERQARELAEVFRDIEISVCFSSDLIRAKRTAELIVEGRGIPLVTDRRLRELDFGRWEGLSYEDIVREYPEESAAWIDDPVDASPPEGESLRNLQGRVNQFLMVILSGRMQLLLEILAGRMRAENAEAIGSEDEAIESGSKAVGSGGEAIESIECGDMECGVLCGETESIPCCTGGIQKGLQDRSIMIVSHGGPIRAILCVALGMKLSDHWRIKIENGGYAIVEFFPESGINEEGSGMIFREKGILCQLVNPGEARQSGEILR